MSDDLSNDPQETQPEKTFDEHIASLIKDFKDKVDDSMEVVLIVKRIDGPAHLMTQGHPFDTTAMAAGYVREMKEHLGQQLEC